MPRFRVQTNQGIFEVEANRAPSEDELRDLISSGRLAPSGEQLSAQPSGATAADLATRKTEDEQIIADEARRQQGPLSRLVNTVTEFASPDPPGGPRRRMIPEVTLLPKAVETAFTSFLLTAAPTATATQLAQQFAKQAPRVARMVPLLTEMATSFLTRRQNVAQGFEEPGTTGDVLAAGLPAAGRAVGAAARATGQRLAPSVSQESAQILKTTPPTPGMAMRELIEEGGDTVTTFTRGQTLRATMRDAEQQLGALTDEAFGAVRQKVAAATGGDLIDMTDIADMAKRMNTTLDAFGVETVREGTDLLVSFDDALKLSSRTFGRALSKSEKDRIGTAALRRLHSAINAKIGDVAELAGASDDLAQARTLFAQDVVPRFRSDLARRLLNDVRTSAEQLVTKAPNLSVQDAVRFQRTVVNVAKELDEGGRAVFSQADTLHEFHTGVAATLLKRATNAETGQIQPGALLRAIDRMEPEVRRIVLGGEGAKALREFALKLSQSQRRLTMGIGVVGMGALSTAGGAQAGALGAGAALEAANELNMIGRLIVGNPKVFRALLRRVLNGEPAAIRDFTAMTGVRIGGQQALQRGLTPAAPSTAPPFPETASQPIAR